MTLGDFGLAYIVGTAIVVGFMTYAYNNIARHKRGQ